MSILMTLALMGSSCGGDGDQSVGGGSGAVNSDNEDDDVTPNPDDDDDDDTEDDDTDDEPEDPIETEDDWVLKVDPYVQAAVPGDELQYRATIERPDEPNIDDPPVFWTLSNTDLAEIDEDGLVTVKDYGNVVIRCVTNNVEGTPTLEAEVKLYIQADILVLDRKNSRMATIDYSSDNVVDNYFAPDSIPKKPIEAKVAGDRIFIIGDGNGTGVIVKGDLPENPSSTKKGNFINATLGGIPGSFDLVGSVRAVISMPTLDVVLGYNMDGASIEGYIIMPQASTPHGVDYDFTNNRFFISLPYVDGEDFGSGRVEILNGEANLVLQEMNTSGKNPILFARIGGTFMGLNGGDQKDGIGGTEGTIDVYNDVYTKVKTLDLGGNPGPALAVGDRLIVGDKDEAQFYIISGENGAENAEILRGAGDPVELPEGGAVTALNYDHTRQLLYVGNDDGDVYAYDGKTDDFVADWALGDIEIVDIDNW
ncbi:MAG: hypothetical protein H6684_02265 [Deltaproteobacteria bacterium]|nr:hypothetical protein [Deltaproteobacteria bacterium]